MEIKRSAALGVVDCGPPLAFKLQINLKKQAGGCFMMRIQLAVTTILGLLMSLNSLGASRRVQLSGEAIVSIADDFQNKKSQMHYQIREKQTGRFRTVNFPDDKVPSWFKTGHQVQVSADENEVGYLLVYDGEASTTTTVTSTAYATDNRSIIIIRVHLTDGASYLSQSQIEDYMFRGPANVRDYFLQNTLGKTTFNLDRGGDGVNDIYDVNIDWAGATGCSFGNWSQLADQAMVNQGVDVNQYQHILYVMPKEATIACAWAGLAYMNGPRAWVRHGGFSVIAHELGHNLGLSHASTDLNNDEVTDSEYGDRSCVMGVSSNSTSYLNAPHMEQLGVFQNFSDKVAVVTQGQFQISALSLDPRYTNSKHILKIARSTKNEYYYLSFRKAQGMDASLPIDYTRGVSIHKFSASLVGRTSFVKGLAPGETFVDSANGISIYAGAISGDGQSMDVTVDAPPACLSANPTVTTSDALMTSDLVSGYKDIFVTVKNNDSSACIPTQFTMSSSSSISSISVSYATPSVQIAPEQSVTIPVRISWSNLAANTFTIRAIARDIDGLNPTHYDVTTGMTLQINNPPPPPPALDTTAPSSVSNLRATIQKNGRTSLTWGVAVDSQSEISHYEIYRQGIYLNSAINLSYVDSFAVSGTEYSVRAVDGAGNKGPLTSVISGKSTSSGGKGSRKGN